MVYPKIFKSLALSVPVMKDIVSERDELRNELGRVMHDAKKLQEQNVDLKLRLEINSAEIKEKQGDIKISDSGITANQNAGYCHCCRSESIFQINNEWLRDHYVCLKCFSIPRQRHLQYVLDNYWKGWEQKVIHESSPSNVLISQYCNAYSKSQFFDGVPGGEIYQDVRCENLESMTFPDSSFDIFITQDVFEHIFNPNLAAKEIARVLKPGGIHIFSAPKYEGLDKSFRRAQMSGAEIDYLHEAEYHGNPVGDGKSLVTFHYGDDFENLIFRWSGMNTTTYVTRCRDVGIDGKFIEVFVSKKTD